MTTNASSAMNDTKWAEIRAAMGSMEKSPGYRTRSIDNGYISSWDYDWFYHFPLGGYKCIEWLEISCETEVGKALILKALKKIHVPGKAIPTGFIIYGYIHSGQAVEYI